MTTSRRSLVSLIALAIAPALLTACAATTQNVDRMAAASLPSDETVVIGRLVVIKDGQEMTYSDGPLTSNTRLQLTDARHGTTVRAEVGTGGEFAWPLHPELYRINAIEIIARGQRLVFPTYLSFAASRDMSATYVGTITLEVDIDSGYYGIEAKPESMTVHNDCRADCEAILADLGFDSGDIGIALAQPDVALATASTR